MPITSQVSDWSESKEWDVRSRNKPSIHDPTSKIVFVAKFMFFLFIEAYLPLLPLIKCYPACQIKAS